jgi:hypothetical protein
MVANPDSLCGNFSYASLGLIVLSDFPTACAVGFILAPLCG